MFEFLFSLITKISLMISSFLGCCCRFICLMATWEQDTKKEWGVKNNSKHQNPTLQYVRVAQQHWPPGLLLCRWPCTQCRMLWWNTWSKITLGMPLLWIHKERVKFQHDRKLNRVCGVDCGYFARKVRRQPRNQAFFVAVYLLACRVALSLSLNLCPNLCLA